MLIDLRNWLVPLWSLDQSKSAGQAGKLERRAELQFQPQSRQTTGGIPSCSGEVSVRTIKALSNRLGPLTLRRAINFTRST